MRKQSEHLFKIGEIAKILGVTRKTILVYEEMGLLTPAVKDEASGYRYYTADNMTQIRAIRSLQTLGLSLAEIREYYYDTENLDRYLDRLMDLRATLDRNIHLLQLRATKPGDLSVHRVRLPRQVCFCRRYQCTDAKDAAIKLRDTYIAAARTGKCPWGAACLLYVQVPPARNSICYAASLFQKILWVKSGWSLRKCLPCASTIVVLTKESIPRLTPYRHMYRKIKFRQPADSTVSISKGLLTAETIQKTTSHRLPCPSQRIVRDVCK